MEVREQRRESRYVYLTSVLLVVIVLAIGLSTMNNYDKMNSVQNSIETLSSNMGANGSSGNNAQQDAQNSDEQSDQQIAEQTGQGDQGESVGGLMKHRGDEWEEYTGSVYDSGGAAGCS